MDWQEKLRIQERVESDHIGGFVRQKNSLRHKNTLEAFEIIGELYRRVSGCLRPGKDDPVRDSNTPENYGRFNAFINSGLRDAMLMDELIRLRERLEQLDAGEGGA